MTGFPVVALTRAEREPDTRSGPARSWLTRTRRLGLIRVAAGWPGR